MDKETIVFTITFFDKTSAFSKNVLIGTAADGVMIEDSVLREILFLSVSRCYEASAADFEGLKKLYEERKPQIVQKVREEQNDTLNFEIGRIRQRAEDKKREFAAEIEILTREIDSMKRKGTTKHTGRRASKTGAWSSTRATLNRCAFFAASHTTPESENPSQEANAGCPALPQARTVRTPPSGRTARTF